MLRGSVKPCVARRLAGIFSIACLARKGMCPSIPLRKEEGLQAMVWLDWCLCCLLKSYWGNWLPSPLVCKEMFNAWVLQFPQLS